MFKRLLKRKSICCLTLTTQRSTMESSHSMYASIGDCSSNRRSNSWYTVTGRRTSAYVAAFYITWKLENPQKHLDANGIFMQQLPRISVTSDPRQDWFRGVRLEWIGDAPQGVLKGEWTCLTFWSPSLMLWLCWSWEWSPLGALFVWK